MKMAREEFIENLRLASRMLARPRVSTGQGAETDAYISSQLDSADLWLTRKVVEGFDVADFADWPKDQREELGEEVAAFSDIVAKVPATNPATRAQSKEARKHLERIIQIVGRPLLHEWLDAQQEMLEEAIAAAQSKGWYVEKDEKQVLESLLGEYNAPRLRIKTPHKEVVLDPIARFGSGRQGVVDLVVLPTYETAYLVTFKDGRWQIISPHGRPSRRPFNRATLVNTITHLSNR
jgi:hypothetical protein